MSGPLILHKSILNRFANEGGSVKKTALWISYMRVQCPVLFILCETLNITSPDSHRLHSQQMSCSQVSCLFLFSR